MIMIRTKTRLYVVYSITESYRWQSTKFCIHAHANWLSKVLASLIRTGQYSPSEDVLDVAHLRDICQRVGIPVAASDPKVNTKGLSMEMFRCNTLGALIFLQHHLFSQLERLHSFVIQGHSECHVFEAAPLCTGGKVFKNCHHQVVAEFNCSMQL